MGKPWSGDHVTATGSRTPTGVVADGGNGGVVDKVKDAVA
jgi:hypothetical protein